MRTQPKLMRTVRLERWVPAAAWLRGYDRATLGQDLFAALIVTLMLIPQSLAYAMLAGLPPQVGLYASIAPLIAYAAFGTSRTLSVGPVAVVSLMTAAAVGDIAASGTAGYVEAALVLALLSGLVLLGMALLRLGFLATFLSHPVISGFITASAVLIAASQLKHILGVRVEGDTLLELVPALVNALPAANLPTLVIGVLATAFLFWVRKGLKPLLLRIGLPVRAADFATKAGPVVAIIATTLAVAAWDLASSGVRVVGAIPAGLPPLSIPRFDAGLWVQLLPAAALISLVGFVESISVAQTLAAKRRERIDANQELVGLGSANVAAALTGGYPVTGGFARSVVNFDAGARTQLAGVFTAAGIALVALLFTPLFRNLPQAALAATIIVAVLSLVDLGTVRHTWRYSRSDFSAMAVTILVVLAVGVEAGIVAGVALSIVLYLWRTSRPHIAVVGQVPGTEHFRNIERHAVLTSPHVLSVRVDESLYFANARYLEDRLYDEIARRPEIRDVVLMCPAVNYIDASALDSLEVINDRLRQAGVRFHLTEVKGPVFDRLQRSRFLDHLSGRVFLSQHQAMAALDPDVTRQADESSPASPSPPAGAAT
ncbi:MAG TPA: sulfate permease [Sphingobium sp.]|nr:sulfate permease [Sphingobium sp.]